MLHYYTACYYATLGIICYAKQGAPINPLGFWGFWGAQELLELLGVEEALHRLDGLKWGRAVRN